MEKIKVKKLYCGFVSVRDYIIKKCLKEQKGIILKFEDKIMTIPYNKLKVFQLHKRKFKSKFNNKEYELVDFKFIPDNIKTKQIKLF